MLPMKNVFLKFPFTFSQDLMLQDLSVCSGNNWNNHFNQRDYNGEWTSISLRSASGSENDIYSHPDAAYKNTELLEKCKYFIQIIDSFKCEKESIRLLSLAPKSIIKEHRDIQLGYAYGLFRIHIPIQTGEDVSFVVGGQNLPMKNGECCYADFNLPHSVENNGSDKRIHLVIDCKRNTWSDQLFKEAGYDFEYEKKLNGHDVETKKKMISELSKMGTETSRQLVEKLMKEIEDDE